MLQVPQQGSYRAGTRMEVSRLEPRTLPLYPNSSFAWLAKRHFPTWDDLKR